MRYIDGASFKRVMLAGAAKVMRALDKLNAINVFPVPDGDTGTNLALTLKGGVERLLKLKGKRHLGEVARELAEGTLLEAKGNSGVIFSQFLVAFAEEVEHKNKVTVKEFAEAVDKAIKKTYQALEDPKEGTILTVIREAADEALKSAQESDDVIVLLERMFQRAKKALERTKEQLPELKKADVVDAGGLGFVYFLEGIVRYIKEGVMEKLELGRKSETVEDHAIEQVEDLEHRYCTEAVVKVEGVSGQGLKKLLAALGSSLIVVGAGKLFHIHIHTNWPQKVFSILKEKGEILKKKVDDMLAMNRMFRHKRVGFVVDSAADVPLEILTKYDIYIVPLHVIVDNTVYRDGVDISREEVQRLLLMANGPKLGTSQASPFEFQETYRRAAERAGKLLVFTIAAGLSGTYRSALTAASSCKEAKVYVVDTKSISLGQSMIMLRAIEKIEQGWSIDSVINYIENEVIPSVYFLFTIKTFKYLLRSGRVGKLQGKLAELLGIKPILSLRDGREVYKVSKAFGRKRAIEKMKQLFLKNLDKTRTYDFGIAHFVSHDDVVEFEEFFRSNFKVRNLFINELTPALSLHLGPGALGVFAMPIDED